MKIYLLKQETNSPYRHDGIAAVATSVDSAIKLLKEWYNEEKEEKTQFESCECQIKIDGVKSYASIRNERGAYLECRIEENVTDDFLD